MHPLFLYTDLYRLVVDKGKALSPRLLNRELYSPTVLRQYTKTHKAYLLENCYICRKQEKPFG